MSQVFGEFNEQFQESNESLELSFSFSDRPSEKRWRNNRLSAYFIADYLVNYLSINEDESQGEERIEEIKNSVSYIGNELLENAIKFNEDSDYSVEFGLHFWQKGEEVTVAIFAKNTMKNENVQKFKSWIEQLLSGNTNELYVQQIEKTAESEDNEASGLGLLTVINDYSAKLGWKFDTNPNNSQNVVITTMAQIVV